MNHKGLCSDFPSAPNSLGSLSVALGKATPLSFLFPVFQQCGRILNLDWIGARILLLARTKGKEALELSWTPGDLYELSDGIFLATEQVLYVTVSFWDGFQHSC